MRIGLITIWTNNIEEMTNFYSNLFGFKILEDLGDYVESQSEGVRFAICKHEVMRKITGHTSFDDQPHGQIFELAFPIRSLEEVISFYNELEEKGVNFLSEPEMMPWGRMTSCFVDPDGNIHEIYSLKEGEQDL